MKRKISIALIISIVICTSLVLGISMYSIKELNDIPKEIEINGPTLLSLGALSQYNQKNNRYKFVWNRMGVNNKFTANELTYLIEQKQLPPFTLAYLPDADASIHKHGPDDLKGIEKADQALQNLLNSFSSWEEAIQKVTWIVLGDSGQSLVNKDKETSLINLNHSLKSYTFWEGKKRMANLLSPLMSEWHTFTSRINMLNYQKLWMS